MHRFLLLPAVATLAACSPQQSPTATTEVQGSGADAMVSPRTEAAVATDVSATTTNAGPVQGQTAPVRVSVPQLAYSYRLGFILPGKKVSAAVEAHRALCEQMGISRCQLLALQLGDRQDAHASASMKLRVATADARRFQSAMGKAVTDAGGRAMTTNVAAEDVSKAIVDTQARIRQRELLVERLTEILRTRTGKVAELLEAERSIAQAQEELDQARGWLAELQGRVAMSDFEISYSAVAPSASTDSVGWQLGEAVQDSAGGFLIGLRVALTMLIYLLPWALLAVPGVLLWRRFRRRKPAGAATVPPADA